MNDGKQNHMEVMIDALKFIRKWTGLIVGLAVLFPFLFNSYYLNFNMNMNGIQNGGALGDYNWSSVFELIAFILLLILMPISRFLLKEWHKPTLYILLGIIIMTLSQNLTVLISNKIY